MSSEGTKEAPLANKYTQLFQTRIAAGFALILQKQDVVLRQFLSPENTDFDKQIERMDMRTENCLTRYLFTGYETAVRLLGLDPDHSLDENNPQSYGLIIWTYKLPEEEQLIEVMIPMYAELTRLWREAFTGLRNGVIVTWLASILEFDSEGVFQLKSAP